MVMPVVCEGGVKAMSFGWVNSKAGVPGAGGDDAAVVRGPIASKVATQVCVLAAAHSKIKTKYGKVERDLFFRPSISLPVHWPITHRVEVA
jgi:hypothetical protein